MKNSDIYKAVFFAGVFPPRILRVFIKAFFAGAGLFFALSLFAGNIAFSLGSVPLLNKLGFVKDIPVLGYGVSFNFSGGDFIPFHPGFWQGLGIISIGLGLFILFFYIFFEFFLKFPEPKETDNPADLFSFNLATVFNLAFDRSAGTGESEMSLSALIHSFVNYGPAYALFMRAGITPEHIKEGFAMQKSKLIPSISFFVEKPTSTEVSNLLAKSNENRKRHGHSTMTMGDLFVALFDASPEFQKMIVVRDMNKEDLDDLARWKERDDVRREKKRRWWSLENLTESRPIGAEWAYGYPVALQRYAIDITRKFSEGAQINFIDREKEIAQLEETLSRDRRQNILLVGEAGMGKKAIVYRLAQRISRSESVDALNDKKVLELNMSAILSASSDSAAIQNLLGGVLSEATEVGNAILFIDGLPNFISKEAGLGRSDVSQVLIPFLSSPEMHIIATADPAGFHKSISSQSGLASLFEKINVEELSEPYVVGIIEDEISAKESAGGLFFLYSAIKTIYNDAKRYIQGIPFPEKALNLLEEVASYAKAQGRQVVGAQDVHQVTTRKTAIPLGDIGAKERERLILLEKEMHAEIIGQDTAVRAVVQTLQRLRAGLTREEKPAGVFLFVGPTGVGKTLTAQVLAKIYFGSEDKMIRFDMSEYQVPESITSFLGSVEQNEPGRLVSAVRDNPFSVILLDEFEKAHKDILNVFLRVFDEGKMTDAFGRTVNFENTIIIATSNAGAQQIRNMVQQGIDPSQEKEKLINLFINEGYFKPELLNRFDEIVAYRPLAKQEIVQIAGLLIAKLKDRLRQKGYYFNPTEELVNYVANIGFDPQFGARPMNRAIQDKIEAQIARLILENKIQKSQEFTISVEEIENSQ
ncbi:MAG: ATP-dependent Clp protease ATP-binding subunit [Candidatus Spechtbacterales bacterium]